MSRYLAAVGHLIKLIVASLILLILLLVCIQVFCRFVLNSALPWPEEAVTILMIWSLFLGGAFALLHREHMGINYFVDRLPPKLKAAVDILVQIIIVGTCGVIIYSGYFEAMMLKDLHTGALGISRAWAYSAVPISAVLYLIFAIYLIIKDIKGDI